MTPIGASFAHERPSPTPDAEVDLQTLAAGGARGPDALSQRPFRVVRVIARLNVGGPARHVMSLTAGLADRYPTLLVTGAVGPGEADLIDEARARGLAVCRIPELGRSVHPAQDAVALYKLARILIRTRPAILHTHTAKAGTLGRLAAVMTGVPLRVHTFHGHVFHGYFGGLTTKGIVTAERTLARVTDRIVAISPGQADDLTNRYRICPASAVRMIPLGLDLERFLTADRDAERAAFRAELGLTDEHVVSIVGRLEPVKNHDLFLAAAARLLESGRRVVFAVVGGGAEEQRLIARARDLGLGDRVRFLGWRFDLERIYSGSDVITLTSRNEGTPVSLIEALATGRAVVATGVGGVPDVLEGGRVGRLARPEDAADIARLAGELLDQPDLRAALGSAGRSSVRQRYAAARLCDEVSRLYDELVATETSTRAPGARPTRRVA